MAGERGCQQPQCALLQAEGCHRAATSVPPPCSANGPGLWDPGSTQCGFQSPRVRLAGSRRHVAWHLQWSVLNAEQQEASSF